MRDGKPAMRHARVLRRGLSIVDEVDGVEISLIDPKGAQVLDQGLGREVLLFVGSQLEACLLSKLSLGSCTPALVWN